VVLRQGDALSCTLGKVVRDSVIDTEGTVIKQFRYLHTQMALF
jgi:hypothetical protein